MKKVTGVAPDSEEAKDAFWELVKTVARLRSPDGCPWDRQQTLETIKPYTLEETYEVLEAIDSGDPNAISEELGDLLLQVVLYAQIASDQGLFDILPIIRGITEKMVRRHPHVFSEAKASTAAEVITHWEHAKSRERQRSSALEGIPKALPMLARAYRVLSKASRKRPENSDLLKPVHRLLGETPATEESAGNLLLGIVEWCRQSGINPEEALRKKQEQYEQEFRAWEAGGT